MFPTKLIDLQMSPSVQENCDFVLSAQPTSWQMQAKEAHPGRASFRAFNSEPNKKLRQEMLEEVNQEADLIMKECNLFLEEPITDFSEPNMNPSRAAGFNIFQEIGMKLITNKSPQLSTQIGLKSVNPHKRYYHIVETQLKKCQGRLKFFDEAKNYGFIIMDRDGSDIFVYLDDLQKTGLTKEFLKTAKYGNLIRLELSSKLLSRFSFTPMEYFGKYQKSRKAIDLEYLKPSQSQNPFMMMIPTIRI